MSEYLMLGLHKWNDDVIEIIINATSFFYCKRTIMAFAVNYRAGLGRPDIYSEYPSTIREAVEEKIEFTTEKKDTDNRTFYFNRALIQKKSLGHNFYETIGRTNWTVIVMMPPEFKIKTTEIYRAAILNEAVRISKKQLKL